MKFIETVRIGATEKWVNAVITLGNQNQVLIIKNAGLTAHLLELGMENMRLRRQVLKLESRVGELQHHLNPALQRGS